MNALLIASMGNELENPEDDAVEAALVPHIAAVFGMLLPATMVIVHVYLHYDISKGLVTLSQYVHDVTTKKSVKEAEKTLAALRVIKDTVMKDAVESDTHGLDEHKDLDFIETCDVVRINCLKVSAPPGTATDDTDDENDDGLPLVSLLNSLWASEILLDRRMIGGAAKRFRHFYLGFASAAIFTIVITLFYMGFLISEEIPALCGRRWMDDGHGSSCKFHPEVLVGVIVHVVSLLVVCAVAHAIAVSLWWCIRDMKTVKKIMESVSSKTRMD